MEIKMAEALSQKQIDELLNKVRSGNISNLEEVVVEDKLKGYDFTSPKKFTKDQLRSVTTLYENFARFLSSYFTGMLRSVCEVTIVSIEEQRYNEFSNAMPDNILAGLIRFNPISAQHDETTLLLDLPTTFGFLVIDRFMGGSEPVYAPERDYSDIEMELLRSLLEKLTFFVKEAWANFLPVETTLHSIETNGRLLQAFSQQDIVVIITFDIEEENFKGTANICMPAENLEESLKSFSAKYTHAVKQQNPEKEKVKKDLVMDYLKQSDLSIEAILESCQMSLSDIALLQVNDVISLNKKIDSDIQVNVEGVPWYTARIGEVDSKKAVKLVDSLSKGKEG